MSTLVGSPRPAAPVVPTLRWAGDGETWNRSLAAALRTRGVRAAVVSGVATVLVRGEAMPLPGMSARTAEKVA